MAKRMAEEKSMEEQVAVPNQEVYEVPATDLEMVGREMQKKAEAARLSAAALLPKPKPGKAYMVKGTLVKYN